MSAAASENESDPTRSQRAGSPPVAPEPGGGRTNKRRRLRKFLLWIVAVFIVTLACAAAAPAILSTGPCVHWLASIVSGQLAGTVEIESLELAWGAGQRATGFKVLDPAGKPILEVAELRTELGLWAFLMRGSAAFGSTVVSGLRADLHVDESGASNLAAAIAPAGPRERRKQPSAPLQLPPTLAFDMEVTGATVVLSAPGIPPVVFEDLRLRATLPALSRPLVFECAGRSRQEQLAGAFSAKGMLSNAFDDSSVFRLEKAEAKVEARTDDLPTGAFDALFALDGLLSALLGDEIDIEVAGKVTPAARAIDLALKTPNCDARLRGNASDDSFVLAEPGQIVLTITPECAERLLAHGAPPGPVPALVAAVPLQCVVAELRIPLAGNRAAGLAAKADFEALAEARFRMPVLPANAAGDAGSGDMVIRGLRGAVATENLSAKLTAALHATIEDGAGAGRIAIDADARNLFGADGRLAIARAALDAKAEATHIPLAFVDRLLATGGLLEGALGSRLEVALTSRAEGDERVHIDFELSSPYLATDRVIAEIHAGRIECQPFQVTGTVTPALAERLLPRAQAVRLLEPAQFSLRVDRLAALLPEKGTASLQVAEMIAVGSAGLNRLHIDTGARAGVVLIEAIDCAFSGDPVASTSLTARLLVSQPAADSLLGEITGPEKLRVTCDARAAIRDARRIGPIDFKVELASSRLKGTVAGGLREEFAALTLNRATAVELTATPALLDRLGIARTRWRWITGPTPLVASVQEFEIDLHPADFSRARGEISMQLRGIREGDDFRALFGDDVKLTLQAAPRDEAVAVSATIDCANLRGKWIGKIDGGGVLSVDQANTLELRLTPELLARFMDVSIDEAPLAEPAVLSVTLRELRAPLTPFTPGALSAAIDVATPRCKLRGGAALNGATLSDMKWTSTFEGERGRLQFDFSAGASLPGAPRPGALAARGAVQELFHNEVIDLGRARCDMTAEFDAMPVAIVEAIFGMDGRVVPAVGPVLDLEGKAVLSGMARPAGTIALKAKAEHLKLDAEFLLAEDLAELTHPAALEWTLSAQGYLALVGSAPEGAATRGTSPAQKPAPKRAPFRDAIAVTASIGKLRWPLAARGAATTFDPARAAVEAVVRCPRVLFERGADGGEVEIADLNLSASGSDLTRPLLVSGAARIHRLDAGAGANASDAAAKDGVMQFNASLSDLFDETGVLRLEGCALQANAEAKAVPASILDAWSAGEPIAQPLLGDEVNLTVAGAYRQKRGSVEMELTATHARGRIKGDITDAVLTLAEPAVAEVDATKELGTRLLVNLSPILNGVHGEQPIRCVVAQKGFALPLREPSIRNLSAPEIRLDIGQVTIENDVLLEQLLALAKRESRAQMPAWLTPVVIEVRNGRAAFTRRLDLLVDNSLHLTTWGSIDLSDFAYAETLALSTNALSKLFGLKNLEEGDLFSIPIRGTSKKPQIDFKKAFADMAALQAKDRGITALLEEAAGIKNAFARALVEGQLKEAARKLGEYVRRGDKPPPPSAPVLPWEEKK